MPVGNALVRGVLRSPAHRMMSKSLMLLTYTGRRSGRRYTLPVGYVRDGDEIIVVAGRAQAKSWWQNLRGPQKVEMLMGGRKVIGEARLADPDRAPEHLARYLEKLPRAAKAFGVRRGPDGLVTRSEAARAASEHQVIVIRPRGEG
jgi:deazaflavin-dependent oxidoreductase (nitroreductase family)